MWKKVNHPLFGQNVWAWVWTYGGSPSYKRGLLSQGQVWAQFDCEAPYRPATLA